MAKYMYIYNIFGPKIVSVVWKLGQAIRLLFSLSFFSLIRDKHDGEGGFVFEFKCKPRSL